MANRGMTWSFTCLALVACGGAGDTASGTHAPVLDVAATVEVGVVDGDRRYMFQDISAASRLSNGELVVADRGTAEVSIYDPSGTHIRTFGRPGDGPGEFQNVAGIYVITDDSVMVADGFSERVSIFDSNGAFARSLRYADLPGDSLFPLGTWIFGRFVVQGGVGATGRTRVEEILAQYPVPSEGAGFRRATTDADGRIWILEPSEGTSNTWIALDVAAQASAWIDLPEDFTPLAFDQGTVLGRATDSLDVQYLRAYAIHTGTTSRPVPSWLNQPNPSAEEQASWEQWSPDALTEHVRGLARSQEIYYSTHSTYSSSTDSLDWSLADVDVAFTQADDRGWVGVFAKPSSPTICAMAYGFPIPPGWRVGQLLCGESAQH